MQVAFHEIIPMTAMRNRFMSATIPVRVLTVMRAARMSRGTRGRIRPTLCYGMFIYVPLVGTVEMPVMQIIEVTFMSDGCVSAAWTVRMRVLIVRFVVAHLSCLLSITSFWLEKRGLRFVLQ